MDAVRPDLNICFPGWKLERKLGKGSFGAVYEISRQVFGQTERAALKYVSLPPAQEEIDAFFAEGYDAESLREHYQLQLQEIVREYSIMAGMKSQPNIVHCDDISYYPHADRIGWDIYIKMELLTPLTDALEEGYDEKRVLRLGMDVARALSYCESQGILHRDIKPQNLFLAPDGSCKLGDFGVAKIVEKTSRGTVAGTYRYMAPEVFHSEAYGFRADQYSLGLVLYWLLNERHLPFVPLSEARPSAQQEREARSRRLAGAVIPLPKNGSDGLKRIVLRACSYRPEDRYASAEELYAALSACYFRRKRRDEQEEEAAPEPEDAEHAQKRRSPALWISLWLVLLAAMIALVVLVFGSLFPPELPDYFSLVMGAPAAEAPAAEPEAAPAPELPEAPAFSEDAPPPAEAPAAEESFVPLAIQENARLSSTAYHTVWIRDDGTVDSVGSNNFGERDLDGWANIAAVSTAPFVTYGLKSDGTVVCAGSGFSVRDKLYRMKNIVAIACGEDHLVGLRADGTVIAVGSNSDGQCDVSAWSDVTAIAACGNYTLGLRRDGTVLLAGMGSDDDFDVSAWSDITAISAGILRAAGLRSDGTAVSSWDQSRYTRDWNQIADWSELQAVSVGWNHTVGLRKDGTVLASGSNEYGECDVSDWRDIVFVAAGSEHTVGLRSDGTLIAVGNDKYGACDVAGKSIHDR